MYLGTESSDSIGHYPVKKKLYYLISGA